MANDPFREDISCGLHSFRVEDACNRMARAEEDRDDVSVASVVSAPAVGGVAGEGSGVRCLTLRPGRLGPRGAAGPRKYRTSWPLSILFSKTILLKRLGVKS